MDSLSLNKLKGYTTFSGPLVLIIMDGIGIGKSEDFNGVYSAHTPTLDTLIKEEPLYTKLLAHGTHVGLPTNKDMGNSEVGHNALGAGRVFSQGAQLVNNAIESKGIFNGNSWKAGIDKIGQDGTLHFIGLFSDGNVHSHVSQFYALLDQCLADGLKKVRVHPLLDGRDVGATSALDYILPLEEKLAEICKIHKVDYRIASGGGRMITTMDRYNADWSIVERGWKAHVLGDGRFFGSASEAIRTYYAEDPKMTDQYMESFVIVEDGKPVGTIEDGYSVICFNPCFKSFCCFRSISDNQILI